ncbi:MAG: hypothetical protein SFW35_06370 [Chitinophagales bacterium]|nr:hypothetical protein [Chitinophagales bacterium]
MKTATIQKKLHEIVDEGDERLLKMMYAFAKEYVKEEQNEGYTLSPEEIERLEEDDAAYERGEGKNYTWEEALHIMKHGFPKEE